MSDQDYNPKAPGSVAPTPGSLDVFPDPQEDSQVTGTPADAPYVSGSGSIISILKGIFGKLSNVITGASGATAAAVMEMGVSASGTLLGNVANNSLIVQMPEAAATLGFSITGLTASGAQLQVDVSPDGGTNWTNTVPVYVPGVGTSNTTLTTDTVTRLVPVSGCNAVRFRIMTAGGGSTPMTIDTFISSAAPSIVQLAAGNNAIGTVLLGSSSNNVGVVRQNALIQSANLLLLSAPIISAASTNISLIKNGAANLFGAVFGNTAATWAYVKFYNKVSAPVPGTDTPFAVLALPPGGQGVLNLQSLGYYANLGLGIAITLNPALNDATALGAANTVIGHVQYI